MKREGQENHKQLVFWGDSIFLLLDPFKDLDD
jgi:hypothetical protein